MAVLALALTLLAATGCRKGRADWRITQLFGGLGSVEVLKSPSRVEAFRIASEPGEAPADRTSIGHYPATSAAVEVDAETSKELSTLLLDPDTYDFLRAKGCEFVPGVGLRLYREPSRVDIALCFSCDELMIFREGRRVGFEDFDAARPRLVAIVKRLFPDDEAIQALE